MPKRSRRFSEALAKVDRMKHYEPNEAVQLVKELSTAKFDETVEIHFRTGADPKYADQQIRGVLTLPHGTGREVRILVFANPEGQAEAEAAGADFVGADDLAQKIQGGWLDFDIVFATPDMMRVVGRLGRVLGPRGMMPSPKTGTILPPNALGAAIQEARLGRVEYRIDKNSNIHVPIGKVSFEQDKLNGNMAAVVDAVMGAKPATVKGVYMRQITLASTMGPGVRVDIPLASTMSEN